MALGSFNGPRPEPEGPDCETCGHTYAKHRYPQIEGVTSGGWIGCRGGEGYYCGCYRTDNPKSSRGQW